MFKRQDFCINTCENVFKVFLSLAPLLLLGYQPCENPVARGQNYLHCWHDRVKLNICHAAHLPVAFHAFFPYPGN